MLIADGHSHVNPKGIGGYQLGKRFKKSGGWFIALVSLPPIYYGLDLGFESIDKSFQIFLKECEKTRSTGVKVACIAGIHPSFIDQLIRRGGPSRVKEILNRLEKAIEELEKLRDQGLIDGFGEFGRPHYKTLPESFVVNELILLRILNAVKDHGGVLHLHLEQAGYATVSSVNFFVKTIGIKELFKIFFHHATLSICREASSMGYMSTLPGRSELIRKAFDSDLTDFIPESDFIDDPERPGVFMYPWEIGSEIAKLKHFKIKDLDDLIHKVMVENVVKVYDVKPP